VRVQIYVEGGGDRRSGDLATECRKAFSTLIERAVGSRVAVTACGGRNQAYDACATAVRKGGDALAILLVDSEELLSADDAWQHLTQRDRWERLSAPAFLMVVATETWLLADHDALYSVFGEGFKEDKIPKWPELEKVEKPALRRALDDAVRGCSKGKYGYEKRHCFAVLEKVDCAKLELACPHAKAFFDHLRSVVSR